MRIENLSSESIIAKLETSLLEQASFDSELFIRYVDFLDEKIILSLPVLGRTKELFYRDIDSFEFIIDIGMRSLAKSKQMVINSCSLKFKSGDFNCSIRANIDLNKIFLIIYYSQFVKKFSYRIDSKSEITKSNLEKLINDYVKNNYRKTFKMCLVLPNDSIALSIVIALIYGFIIFSILVLLI